MVRNSDQIEDLRRGMCGKFMILSVFTEIIRVKSRRVLEGLETQSFDSLEPDSLPTLYLPIQPTSIKPSTLISDIWSYCLYGQFFAGPTSDHISDIYCTILLQKSLSILFPTDGNRAQTVVIFKLQKKEGK